MYQRQQNTLYPQGDRICDNNFLKLLIGSQPILEGRSLICGRRIKHNINLDKLTQEILFAKSATIWGKRYFAADGACDLATATYYL